MIHDDAEKQFLNFQAMREACPHAVQVRWRGPGTGLSTIMQTEAWCLERFGLPRKSYGPSHANGSWYSLGLIYQFADINDAMWFKLVWN